MIETLCATPCGADIWARGPSGIVNGAPGAQGSGLSSWPGLTHVVAQRPGLVVVEVDVSLAVGLGEEGVGQDSPGAIEGEAVPMPVPEQRTTHNAQRPHKQTHTQPSRTLESPASRQHC